GHLRSQDFLHVEQYPVIRFESTRVERHGKDGLNITGNLTIHGVTKEVTLETTANGQAKNPFGQEVSGYSAETSINRKDFGLTWNVALEAGGFLVGDKIKIALEIQAVKQA